jgi:hypothetical protein
MGKKSNKKSKAASKQPAGAAETQPETNVAEAAPAVDAPVAAAAESVAPEVTEPADATATPSDVPGGFPVTPSNEAADLEDKVISVNPLPAAAGTGNPISLAPGEKIPESITAQNINEHVKLDKESYEKSDALPTAPALSTEVPPVSGTMIPESSLPMGEKTDVTNVTLNSAGAGSTTAALAGQVPLESKVPEVVKESQEKAGVAPEASANPEEVQEKAKVEEEIKDKVPEAPATSVGTSGVGTEKKENTGTVIGAAAAAGGAAVAAAVAAVHKFSGDAAPAANDAKTATAETVDQKLPDTVKDKLPESAQNALATDKQDAPLEKVSPEVPKEVKESIAEAGKAPEAAASTSAVEEKKEVETELLREVNKAPAVDETSNVPATKAPVTDAAAATTETKATDAAPVLPVLPVTEAPATTAAADTSANGATAAETKASDKAAPAAPAAAANGHGNGVEANGNGTEAKPAEGSATHDKKKSRLSVMFSKLKAKLK